MKQLSTRNEVRLSIFSVLVTGILIWGFYPMSFSSSSTQIYNERLTEEIKFVSVKEDSLIKAIEYFVVAQSTSFTKKSSNSKFSIEIASLGSNPCIFYNCNTSLLNRADKNFDIKKTPQQRGILASFSRFKEGESYYVNVPTDVLFALLLKHPNVN